MTKSRLILYAALAFALLAATASASEPSRTAPGKETRARFDLSTEVDFVSFGDIAKVPASGTTVHAAGAGYYAIVGVMDFQVVYERQNYTVRTQTPTVDRSDSHEADVVTVKWVSDPEHFAMPLNGRLSLGSMFYFDRARSQDVQFRLPYAALYFEGGPVHANLGVNWVRGDLPHAAGAFASALIDVGPQASVYLDYTKKDLHKLVVNNIILPRSGVDCSQCENDAFSAGLALRLGRSMSTSVGVYDIGDLDAPTGSLAWKRRF